MDEDVEPAKLLHRMVHERLGARGGAKVAGARGAAHAELRELDAHGIRLVVTGAVADADIGAAPGEEAGDGGTDAAGAAGD